MAYNRIPALPSNKKFVLFSLAAFLPFFFSCGSYRGEEVCSDLADSACQGSGKQGGTLVLATVSDPKTFNDIMSQETSSSLVTGYIFEGLTTLDVDTLQVKPNLAESWQVSEDGTQWTFHLRKDVRWNDGQPFTADDVVFTFQDLIYNDTIPSSSRDIFTIQGQIFKVEKMNNHTVRFTLPMKFAPFLRGMSQAILPRHKLQGAVARGEFTFTWGIDTPPEEIVGTGPFRLVKYLPGERLVFRRNPYYWKKSAQGEALPFLEQIIYLIVQNSDVVVLKFLDGEVDVCSIRGNDYAWLKPLEEQKNFTVYEVGPDFGSNFLVFNQNRGINPKKGRPFVEPVKLSWFTDLDFRRAVAHAIDKKKMITILLNELGYPQHGPMSPSAGFFYNPDVRQYPYDLKKARAILTKAGFVDRDNDGILEDPAGHKVKFNLFTNSGNPVREQIAAIIRHDLQRLGMQVNYMALEFNSLVSKLNATFDWDAIILGLTGGIEPHFGKNVWNSRGQLHMWFPQQETPATDWEREIDELFDRGVEELDEEKRKEIYDKWQRIVSEQLPFIYTILGSNIYAVRNKFGNLRPTSYGGVFHNIEEIYIRKD